MDLDFHYSYLYLQTMELLFVSNLINKKRRKKKKKRKKKDGEKKKSENISTNTKTKIKSSYISSPHP